MLVRLTSTTEPARAGAEHSPTDLTEASRKAPLAAARAAVETPASSTAAVPTRRKGRVLIRFVSSRGSAAGDDVCSPLRRSRRERNDRQECARQKSYPPARGLRHGGRQPSARAARCR